MPKKKISFPIPTGKNGFHILNLHPKKHILKKTFFKAIYLKISKIKIESLAKRCHMGTLGGKGLNRLLSFCM